MSTQTDNALLQPAKRRRRRWLWWVAGLFVPIALFAVEIYVALESAEAKVRRALERADRLDPNWRLEELESRRRPVADSENASLRVLAANGKFVTGPATTKLQEQLESLGPTDRLTTELRKSLDAECKQAASGVEIAREVAELPNGRYPLAYSDDVIGTSMPHLSALISVREQLGFDITQRTEKGDTEGAIRSCQALLNVGCSIGDEFFFVSQLMRMSTDIKTSSSLERILARGQASGTSLARLQRLVEEEECFPSLLIAARGERASMDGFLQAADSGKVRRSRLRKTFHMASPRFLTPTTDDMFIALEHGRLKEVHAIQVDFWTDNAEAAKKPLEGTLEEFDALAERKKTLPSWSPLFLPLDKLLDGITGPPGPEYHYRWSRASLRCLAAALATERFRLEKGRWPESLAELVPTFLSKVPLDPYDAKTLRFRLLKDGCVIYSIGPDRNDDGGINLARKSWPLPSNGTDIGLRLWTPDRRQK